MTDRITSMLVFSKTAETGSFAAAAAVLGMSAQMAGRHVALLERRLGARLIERNTHAQHLTDVGEIFLRGLRRVLAELADAEESVSNHVGAPRGTLRIAAPVAIGATLITPRLTRFLDLHPEIVLDLRLHDRPASLIDERLDAAFHLGDLPDSTMLTRALGDIAFVSVASSDYLARRPAPRTPADLADHDLITRTDGSPSIERRSRREPGEPSRATDGRRRLALDDDRAMLDAVLAGLGIAQIAAFQANPHLRSGRLTRVLPETSSPTERLRLVYGRSRRDVPKVKAFVDWLPSALADAL